MMKKFWNFKTIRNEELEMDENILFLNGTIAEESWFDDDITPGLFLSELKAHQGDITVWINSPGGDVVAAAQIYNMLMDHKGNVTVKIDGIAASAASVIAMAGTKVLMSPVSMMMIHNPMTLAFGDKSQMKKAISMLDEVKESILNAYEIKTGMDRNKLAKLMDDETWMNANTAMAHKFCDGVLSRKEEVTEMPEVTSMFSKQKVVNNLMEKLAEKSKIKGLVREDVKASELTNRLNLIKTWRD